MMGRRPSQPAWPALVLFGALFLPAGLGATDTARPTLEALAIDEPIDVDGDLVDSVWQRAEVATDFTQREPQDGQPASEKTEVRVAYTSTTLYVAVRALDSNPDAIVAKEMERDAPLYRDDSIVILLDTFHDRRNGYAFETNANGVKSDALITDEGRDINRQWDGIWVVSCRRTSDGWTAELAIPFSTLRFDPNASTWGLNVRRMIRHKNEEVHWSALSRDIGSPRYPEQYAVFRVSLAGELTGLGGLRRSARADIKPFVVGTLSESPAAEERDRDADAEVGLDVKWGLGKSLALDLTYNTDFAEVEVDQQQINLTRFSLFFPEKREFFLENAGIFEFGLPSRDSVEPSLMKVFFSRRIGLDQGRQVPIELGARLTGRAGGWNVGVLDVLTEATSFADGAMVGDTNFAVARLKRNLGRRSGVGMIFTDRNESDANSNSVYGLDVDFKPTTKLDFAAFLARTQDRSLEGDDTSWGYGFGYSGRDLRASFEHTAVPEAFDPGVGFLLRRDFERIKPLLQYRPRINRWGIRSWFFEALVDYFARSSTDELESRRISLSAIGMMTTHDDGGGLYWVADTERLFEPFEIHPGIVIPPGLYSFDGWQLGARTNEARRVSASGRFTVGDFFDGERESMNVQVQLRFSRYFRAMTSLDYADVELPQGAFVTKIWGQRLSFSFTPDLRLNAFFQYNDAAELVAANIRFNWIYKPGADLFLVYNETWDAPSFGARATQDRQLIVKFTYLFQR